MKVSFGEYPMMLVRRGDSDMRTLCHVLCDSGYEFPFPIDTSPKWIIDAGANTGMATVYFAKRYPTAKIIAVEPDDGNFKVLKANTLPYGDRVHCVHAALWSENGTISLVDPGSGSWAMRAQASASQEERVAQMVPTVTVEHLVSEYEINRISILKVDIEGGESEVFRDSSSWIGRVDAIAIELHDRYVAGCSENFAIATEDFTRSATRGEDTFVGR